MSEGEEDQEDQGSWRDRARLLIEWGQAHPTTLISVILAAVVVLRVAWASGFDTPTALAIVASLSVTQMLSGVAVVILPTVLVLSAIYVVVWLVDGIRTAIEKKKLETVLVTSSFFLLVLVISAVALSFFSFMLLVAVGILVGLLRPKVRTAYRRSYMITGAVVAAIVFTINSDVWLPAEYVVIDEGGGSLDMFSTTTRGG